MPEEPMVRDGDNANWWITSRSNLLIEWVLHVAIVGAHLPRIRREPNIVEACLTI
jgi:hypothetical protein